MRNLSPVVWSEGMYLAPHHFQAQSRYFEDCLRFAVDSLWFEPWGVAGVEMDGEALNNGVVSLIHARGIFPDGLAFHMPEYDALPEARSLGEFFPPARDSVTVALAVAARGAEGSGGLSANGAPRFRPEVRLLCDELTGRDEKPVQVGHKNVFLRFDTEPESSASVTLPVARVLRGGSGEYILDPDFIPPCLTIAASDRMMSLLGRLIEILEEKNRRFSSSGTGSSWAEFSTREVANFWLLHSVNSSLAPLRHQYLAKRGHPEELYREMLRLGGALCTFANESHPGDLPRYDHRNLTKCFRDLDGHIREHLETVIPTRYLEIPLVKRADYFYEAAIEDQRALDRARWILGIRSAVSEPDLIAKTPQLLKICSKQFVPELVKRALPGLAMTHLPVPPSAIPARADFQYFSVDRTGPCWEHLTRTRELGVYVPGDLPDPAVALWVILEG